MQAVGVTLVQQCDDVYPALAQQFSVHWYNHQGHQLMANGYLWRERKFHQRAKRADYHAKALEIADRTKRAPEPRLVRVAETHKEAHRHLQR